MILLMDNYDSFVYNLYQYIGEALANKRGYDLSNKDDLARIYDEIKVIRNDEMTVEEVNDLNPDYIILSPGPGKPKDAGIHAKELMHGKTSIIELGDDVIFNGIEGSIQIARYHSLAVDKDTLSGDLDVLAQSDDGEIMAVKCKNAKIYGLQFHPESVLTPDGLKIIENFLGL